MPRERPVEEGAADVADMEVSGRRRREADADRGRVEVAEHVGLGEQSRMVRAGHNGQL
jgi:hypothetical protein